MSTNHVTVDSLTAADYFDVLALEQDGRRKPMIALKLGISAAELDSLIVEVKADLERAQAETEEYLAAQSPIQRMDLPAVVGAALQSLVDEHDFKLMTGGDCDNVKATDVYLFSSKVCLRITLHRDYFSARMSPVTGDISGGAAVIGPMKLDLMDVIDWRLRASTASQYPYPIQMSMDSPWDLPHAELQLRMLASLLLDYASPLLGGDFSSASEIQHYKAARDLMP